MKILTSLLAIKLPDAVTAASLLTTTAALLAFLIGFLGLIGRDRKSPYLINTVLVIFLICLAGAAADLFSVALPSPWNGRALILGFGLLLLAFAMSFYRTYMIYLRLQYFVDHISPKNFPIILGVRRLWKKLSNKTTYEYNPLKFPGEVDTQLVALFKSLGAETRTQADIRALCIKAAYLQQGTSCLVDMALICLKNGVCVQYLTASNHPIHFVNVLSRRANELKLDFMQIAGKNLVVIDAYQAHYAFLDSIYVKRTAELDQLGVVGLVAKMSYAGIHTAASRAFNVLKKRTGGQVRGPQLIIYEDPLALADLESVEQYRVFIRHVLPSERIWGSMFTVVVETAPPDAEWRLLQSYADVVIELPPGATKSTGPG
jgi:hypothetical protein